MTAATPLRFQILEPRQIESPTSSAAVIRKRKDDQHKLKLEGLSQRCPHGQRACRLHEGNDEAYECIDTSHELESCGGCIHGEMGIGHDFGSPRHPIGVDCTLLPGITPNGVACFENRCFAFDCEEGFLLVDQTCVRKGL
ncbi:uncharacterized protein L199_008516 [Kwoniella botswanensis]|uniref:uncharacterized protein n=1 Tax=Kwoniella botswanensis TaxID=1268659 RepID=UPI00315D9306